MRNTAIRWTQHTWNWCFGCSKEGLVCLHCYAALITARFNKPGSYAEGLAYFDKDGSAQWTGEVRVLSDKLSEPLHWKIPSLVFVNSISDTFHPKVEDKYILASLSTMRAAHKHVFQILTKHANHMASFFKEYGPTPDNVWIGVTVGNRVALDKLVALSTVETRVRWVSVEPLIEDLAPTPEDYKNLVDLFRPIQWVIIGGESGPGARPMHPEWAQKVRNAAHEAGARVFFKQWGMFDSNGKRHRSKYFDGFDLLDGMRLMEYPSGFTVSPDLIAKHGNSAGFTTASPTVQMPLEPSNKPSILETTKAQ